MSPMRIGVLLEKHYFTMHLVTASALAVGSGEAENTQRDILRDGCNRPYVPGSTLAGALFALVPNLEELFARPGRAMDGQETSLSQVSPLLVEHLLLDDSLTNRRMSVSLNEDKTVKDPFDSELIEGGATGWLRLSLEIRHDADPLRAERLRIAWFTLLTTLLDTISHHRFRIGAKSRRGFGLLVPQVENPNATTFPPAPYARLALRFQPWPDTPQEGRDLDGLEIRESRDIWCRFSWNDMQEMRYPGIRTCVEEDPCLRHRTAPPFSGLDFLVTLRVMGPLIIRTYPGTAKGSDTVMQRGRDQTGIWTHLIPGTTLAGVFRQDFLRQARHAVTYGNHKDLGGVDVTGENLTDALFGKVSGSDSLASGVRISDGMVEGAQSVTLTRNAIDPFTGGTKKGALFQEEICHGGILSFRIEVDGHRLLHLSGEYDAAAPSDQACMAPGDISGLPAWLTSSELRAFVRTCLLNTLMRLHLGMLAVGGEPASGRGLVACMGPDCSVRINGTRYLPEEIHPHDEPFESATWVWKEQPV